MSFRGWAQSDAGSVRDTNQDDYLLRPATGLFAVADGIGGKREGGRASSRLIERLEGRAESLAQLARQSNPTTDYEHRERVLQTLQETLQHANASIFQSGDGDMGTTADVLLLSEGGGFIAHIGDSRIYLVRDDRIFQLTDDHTFAEKLKRERPDAFEQGELQVARFEHVLTRSVGTQPHVDIDTLFVDVQPGDRFFLCSDGLTDGLDESELLDEVAHRQGGEVIETLVQRAKAADGTDNITVVLADVPTRTRDDTSENAAYDTLRKVSFIEQLELFEGLDRQELLKVLRIIYRQMYRDGEYILHRGEGGSCLFMVVEGEVSIRLEGREVARLEAGAHFGEFALLDDDTTRSADVVAVDDTVLLAMPGEQFWGLVEHDDPELGNRLLRNLFAHAAERLRDTTERMIFE